MRQTLKLHPDCHCTAVTRIDVVIERSRSTQLTLRYLVIGRIGDVRLAAMTSPTRTDELWRTTCFEVFQKNLPNGPYREFNFAPSTQWAAYQFSGYREGMTPATEIAQPHIDVQSDAERFDLKASLELPNLPNATRLAISAVIEETNGRKSYWALAHPPGKPDFHHADGFTIDLAKTDQA